VAVLQIPRHWQDLYLDNMESSTDLRGVLEEDPLSMNQLTYWCAQDSGVGLNPKTEMDFGGLTCRLRGEWVALRTPIDLRMVAASGLQKRRSAQLGPMTCRQYDT
jgi:hypothetical protein